MSEPERRPCTHCPNGLCEFDGHMWACSSCGVRHLSSEEHQAVLVDTGEHRLYCGVTELRLHEVPMPTPDAMSVYEDGHGVARPVEMTDWSGLKERRTLRERWSDRSFFGKRKAG